MLRFSALGLNCTSTMKWTTAGLNLWRCKETSILAQDVEFLSESMLVSHSRDHKENVYGCNECLWHFNTVAGLIKHCQDTHNDRHFACTTCGEVFASNPDLCRHTQSHHVKLCHLCHRIFVSEDKLIAHMSEIHLGSTVHTQEEMIEDEQARVHAV